MTIPAVIFWLLAAYALFSRGAFFVTLPWLCLPFGAMAVLDPALTFGSTIQPTYAALALFVLRVALRPGGAAAMWRSAGDFRRFGFLSLFTGYAVLSAYICPRLFEGRVLVIPLRATSFDRTVALAPTSANFTQAAYTALTFLVALSIYALLTSADAARWRRALVRAIFAGSGILILTGLIDLAGAKSALEVFRNGSYGIEGYTMVGNFGRVTGAFAEASSFGSTCVFLFALCFFLAPTLDGLLLRRFIGPAIALLLLALAAVSTSSTAYAGIAAVTGFAVLIALVRAAGWMRDMPYVLAILSALALAFCLALIIKPAIFTGPLQLINDGIFQKPRTLSYIQRHYWTEVGYQAFWDTWGMGAGAGAARVSSWPAAIASNVGLFGLCTMAAQLFVGFAGHSDEGRARAISTASRATLWASLVMGYFAATTLDPGFGFAAAIGMAAAARPLPLRARGFSNVNRYAASHAAEGPHLVQQVPRS